jgi:actin-related protein
MVLPEMGGFGMDCMCCEDSTHRRVVAWKGGAGSVLSVERDYKEGCYSKFKWATMGPHLRRNAIAINAHTRAGD